MTVVTIKNPTGFGKAVKAGGGFLVIKAGASAKDVSVDWTADQRARYLEAGLVIRDDAPASAMPSPAKPAASDAPDKPEKPERGRPAKDN